MIFIVAGLAGLFVALIVDPLDPYTLSTPFCLGLALLALSIRQSPRLVALVSLFYCALTFYAMVQFIKDAPTPVHHPYFWFYQRFGLFLVVCIMSVYVSHYRQRTQEDLAQMRDILGKLPVPVAISDAAGYITYVNEGLATALALGPQEIEGKRYVDLFMTDIQEGKAMRYYIELFGDPGSTVHEAYLRTLNGEGDVRASLICLGTGAERSMITVLQK